VSLAIACVVPSLLTMGCATAAKPGACPPSEAQDPVAATPSPADDPSTELPVTLTSEHISPVVVAAAPEVKKRCWQVALDTRAPDAPTAASVMLHATIEPSGNVSEVRSDGSPPGYPQLAECAAGIVRKLTFHRAAGATTVNIPFIFDANTPVDPNGSR
jgi:hypothetical protein